MDSKKHEKFRMQRWKKGSKWKSELERNLNCQGLYCLHDGKRIFYIGISSRGTMNKRWDPTVASSHDSGLKSKNDNGGKWTRKGKFASGDLEIKIQNNDGKIERVKPMLDFHSFKKITKVKKKRGKHRNVKSMNNQLADRANVIEFLENMLIRKCSFFHRFGGSDSGVSLDSVQFQKNIKALKFLENRTILQTGWTMMNLKDGMPYKKKIQNGELKQNVPTSNMNERAKIVNRKVKVQGKKNPTSKLFNDYIAYSSIANNDFGSSRKVVGTVSLILNHKKPTKNVSSNKNYTPRKTRTNAKKTTSVRAKKSKLPGKKGKTPNGRVLYKGHSCRLIGKKRRYFNERGKKSTAEKSTYKSKK